jgi:hypothetical protein
MPRRKRSLCLQFPLAFCRWLRAQEHSNEQHRVSFGEPLREPEILISKILSIICIAHQRALTETGIDLLTTGGFGLAEDSTVADGASLLAVGEDGTEL